MMTDWTLFRGKFVEVDWNDIVEFDSERNVVPNDPANVLPSVCVSWGYVVYVDDKKLVLETERRGEDHVWQVFPIGCIEDIFLATIETGTGKEGKHGKS